MFGTKAPEHLGTANIAAFQKVPAATALSSLLLHFYDMARLRIDFSSSVEGVYLLQHAARKRIFVIAITSRAQRRRQPEVSDDSSGLSPANAGLLYVYITGGKHSGEMGTIHPMVGGMCWG